MSGMNPKQPSIVHSSANLDCLRRDTDENAELWAIITQPRVEAEALPALRRVANFDCGFSDFPILFLVQKLRSLHSKREDNPGFNGPRPGNRSEHPLLRGFESRCIHFQ